MALGVNFLFRVGRKLLAEPLEDSGLLPGKYYRSQALEALEENDFPECLRYLKMAETHRKAQARMVAQLLIFRCRMLREDHELRLRGLEERLRLETGTRKASPLSAGIVRGAQSLPPPEKVYPGSPGSEKKTENPTFPAQREISLA